MIYKASATFRVFSDLATLVELEKILCAKSAGGYCKGELVSKRNPMSKLRQESLWLCHVDRENEAGEDPSALLDRTLADLLSKIEALLPNVVKIAESSCDILAAVMSDNDQVNCYISKSIIKRIAAADVDFLFSGYASSAER